MIKFIYFDFFGVIRVTGYWESIGEDLHSNGYFHKLTDELDIGRISWSEFIKTIAEKTGRTIEDMKNVFDGESYNESLLAIIGKLKETYKVGLLTNANEGYLLPVLNKAGLDKIFDQIVVSSSVGAIKPQPEIYKYAAKQCSEAMEDILFVDDLKSNVEGAKKVGMKALLYTGVESLLSDLVKLGVIE